MRSGSPVIVLRAWEIAASVPRQLRGAALLACLEEPDAVPVDRYARLSLGERDARLLAWRQALFGEELNGLVECPQCGEAIELTFSPPPEVTSGSPRRVDNSTGVDRRTEHGGIVIDFRLLDSYDLSSIDGSFDAASARAQLLERCVLRAQDGDGTTVALRSLPEDVVRELADQISALDPLADIQLEAACTSCGHRWDAPFDVAPYFWNEIEVAARGLLVDVHDLAAAYGWSESDVLSLSPQRRQAYLELVRG